MKVLSEYLVTVYSRDEALMPLGSYTLFGEDYDAVFNKAFHRLKEREYFTVAWKGDSVFEDWMLP